MSAIEFDYPVAANHCMQAVRDNGAAAIRDFLQPGLLADVLLAINSQQLTSTDNLDAQIPERYASKHFVFPHECQPAIRQYGEFLLHWLGSSGQPVEWAPNDVLIQRYGPEDFIVRHRDYKRSIGLVAVTTLYGEAPFYVELDGRHDKETCVNTRPGTLVLMRGPGLTYADGRPYHRAGLPTSAPRIAVTYRQTIPKSGEIS